MVAAALELLVSQSVPAELQETAVITCGALVSLDTATSTLNGAERSVASVLPSERNRTAGASAVALAVHPVVSCSPSAGDVRTGAA